NFIHSVNLYPIKVQMESTGFIFNRVWRVFKKEALHLVDEDIATFEEVDMALVKSGESIFGIFSAIDRIGLDTVLYIERNYYKNSGNIEDKPPKFLEDMVDKGLLGAKTGNGFYTYPNPRFMDSTGLISQDWLEKCQLTSEKINQITERINLAVKKECNNVVDVGIIIPDDIKQFYKISLNNEFGVPKNICKVFYDHLDDNN
ncbi:MAG: 3-hydroxyacyl-CoA dehydrogenase family protein, partial [Promethearchaeota archaeon]